MRRWLILSAGLLVLPGCLGGISEILCDVSVQTTEVPDGRVGVPYELQLTALAFGCTETVRWRVESGELPPGLMLTPGGLVSGVPTQTGQFEAVLVAQSGGQSARGRLGIGISP